MRGFQRIKKRSERQKEQVQGIDNSLRAKWIRSQLIRKFGGKCTRCNKDVVLSDENDPLYATVDHIIPLSKGGADHISNMTLMHKACNQKKGDGI